MSCHVLEMVYLQQFTYNSLLAIFSEINGEKCIKLVSKVSGDSMCAGKSFAQCAIHELKIQRYIDVSRYVIKFP